ncbi:olfactory receptor 1468-like [Hyperolius riggenbachi]|uniref:olfactory receptor 1468-like n=1 Tax=Hyperolius riggenbachi TaxID=752182 RepID=UPI0035A30A5C
MAAESEEVGVRQSAAKDWRKPQVSYKNNVTTVIFLGFHDMGRFNLLYFFLLLLIYFVTVCGNLIIIMLVTLNKSLHSPMYFFLSQLSKAEIIITTDISPNMLNIVLYGNASMSLSGCITQHFFFSVSEASECFLLTAMSYDRYLAICSPLHYASVMTPVLCCKLVFLSWTLSFCMELFEIFSICQLKFCGPNTIDHFFCDFNPLVNLSCSDTYLTEMEAALLGSVVVVLPFFVITASYTCIVLAIIRIPSFSGRQKSFSTCSSHLTAVSIFYGSLFGMYLLPNEGKSQMASKILAMFYTIFIPLLNPFIYSFRNKGIVDVLRKLHNKAI